MAGQGNQGMTLGRKHRRPFWAAPGPCPSHRAAVTLHIRETRLPAGWFTKARKIFGPVTGAVMSDESFMRRALELAERGRGFVEPNPLVGAVVVKDGRVIGEG